MKQKLLIIRLSALGDVAMTIPAIYTVSEKYPDWEITVLTRPFFARLFVNRPKNIRFILFTDEYKSFKGLMSLVSRLHKEHFTKVADLHNVLRAWIIDVSFMLTGTKVAMLQKRRKERSRLLKGNGENRRKSNEPYVERFADVFEQLGFSVLPLVNTLPAEGSNMLPKSLFEDDGKRWVGIAPFARYANKTYPAEKMKEVVKLLSSQTDIRVFLFGGKDDIDVLKSWEEVGDNVKCVAGTMQIEQELALMHQLSVMVSMDSANMHLASLVGTRVVSVWGSTTFHCGFMGWNQTEDDAVWADVDCQPCTTAGSKTYKCDLKCLTGIAPQNIYEKIMKEVGR